MIKKIKRNRNLTKGQPLIKIEFEQTKIKTKQQKSTKNQSYYKKTLNRRTKLNDLCLPFFVNEP